MNQPDQLDGSTAGVTKKDLETGHREAEITLVHALRVEAEGQLEDPDETEAKDTINQLLKTAYAGTD